MRIFLLVFALLLPINSNFATESSKDKIRNYFLSLKSLESKFIQTDERGNVQQGSLLLSVPGKLRWEYKTPRDILIIMNGDRVYYYDKELDQGSNYLGNKDLVSIFSGEDIFSSKVIKVLNVTSDDKSTTLSFVNVDSSDQITLTFNNNPFDIVKLSVDGENKNKINILFSDFKKNQFIDPKLFYYKMTSPSKKNR